MNLLTYEWILMKNLNQNSLVALWEIDTLSIGRHYSTDVMRWIMPLYQLVLAVRNVHYRLVLFCEILKTILLVLVYLMTGKLTGKSNYFN